MNEWDSVILLKSKLQLILTFNACVLTNAHLHNTCAKSAVLVIYIYDMFIALKKT